MVTPVRTLVRRALPVPTPMTKLPSAPTALLAPLPRLLGLSLVTIVALEGTRQVLPPYAPTAPLVSTRQPPDRVIVIRAREAPLPLLVLHHVPPVARAPTRSPTLDSVPPVKTVPSLLRVPLSVPLVPRVSMQTPRPMRLAFPVPRASTKTRRAPRLAWTALLDPSPQTSA